MALACHSQRCIGVAIRLCLAVLLARHAHFTAADMTASGASIFDCQRGCHTAFKPVCGEDGHTYSNACVAACQEAPVARTGPCPGEPLLHHANQYVVGGPSEGKEEHQVAGEEAEQEKAEAGEEDPKDGGAAPRGRAPPPPRLTRQQLNAFRHEGFRYTGQMRFTRDMPHRHHARPHQQLQHQDPRLQPQQPRDIGTAAAVPAGGKCSREHPATAKTMAAAETLEQQLQMQQDAGLRALRVTREGHVYIADMDDNVDRVLDSIIARQRAAEAEAAAEGASGGELSQPLEGGVGSHNHHHHEHVHAQALLQSLQRWRGYRARGDGGGDEGGKLAARHTIIVPTGGPIDHALQPALDANGGGVAAAAVFAAGSAPPPAAADTTGSSDAEEGEAPTQQQRPPQQQQGQQQGGVLGGWTSLLLGGGSFRNATRDAKPQRQQSGGEGGGKEEGAGSSGGGGGRGAEVWRPVRRSLGIFDADDRIDCPRTPTYPFTAVGQINVRDSSGNYVCSGTLIGPDVVLTAAHCVFSRPAQAFYDRLDFAPSRYRTLDGTVVNPFGVVPWSYVTVYQGYSNPAIPDPNTVDMAVITLSQRIGSKAGWMGVFEPCSPYAPSRYVALTAGYPSDQAPGSCKTTQCVVVQDPCTDGYLYHKCDTASGQSGSPMYMMAMTAGRRMGPYVRAVHNIEWVQELPGGQTMSYINSAVSLTPDHFRSILAWIGPSFTTNGTTPMGPALPPTNYMLQLNQSR